MEVIDEFLDFMLAAYGKQPNQLKTLEKQVLALLAVASTSRFAPKMSRGLLINALTRRTALYAARHPYATIAAFWYGSYSNSVYRPQWAGPHTQEIETAIAIPVFANLGRVLPWVGRRVAPLFNPVLVESVSSASGQISSMRLPWQIRALFGNSAARWIAGRLFQLPGQAINNPVTRGAVGYVSRHPAAALASYFAGSYIDATYRPQFLGPYTRELITAGLVPVFAHAPQAVPPVIRGAGSAAYYSSRGLASITEWFVRRPVATNVTASIPFSSRVFYYLLRLVPPLEQGQVVGWWLANATGRQRQLWEVAAAFIRSGEIRHYSDALLRAETLLAQSEREAASISGRIGYQWWKFRNSPPVWLRRTLDFKYFWAFPRTSQFLVKFSWGLVIPLKFAWALNIWPGLPELLHIPFSALNTAALAGYVAPLFRTGTLGGATAEYTAWAKYGAQIIRHPIQFLRHEVQSLSALLRLPQAASLLARTAPALRFGVNMAGIGVGAAGRGAGTLLRAASSNAVGVVGNASMFVEIQSGLAEQREEDAQIISAIEGRLSSLQTSGWQGAGGNFRASLYRRQIFENLPQEMGNRRRRYLLGHLEAVTNWDEFRRQELQSQETVNVLQIALGAADLSLTAIGQLAENAGQFADQIQSAGFAISAAPRTQPTPQRRDALGRWFREQVPYIAPLPDIGLSFDQALAYINRRAAEAARIMLSSATAGIPIEPVMPGGILGEPAPGKGREFWLYRGRDRRLILQTLRDMQAIVRRDQLAEGSKKTMKLSTRELIFSDDAPGLEGSVIMVIRALKRAASLVRNRGALGGYHTVDEGD